MSTVADRRGPLAARTVAVLLDHAAGFTAELNRGIARFARTRADWALYRPIGLYEGAFAMPNVQRVDGVLLLSFGRHAIDVVRPLGVPMVNLIQMADPPADVPVVAPDNAEAGRLAAEHLLGLGLRRLGYVSLPTAVDDTFRQAGFEAAARRARASCEVASFPSLWNPRLTDEVVRGVGDWVRSIGCPCGVLAFADSIGGPFVAAVRRAGFDVPGDVAVVGIDDDEVRCEFTNPPLSSVNMNNLRVGYEAAALLDRLMAGEPPPASPTLIPPLGVIERGSTQMLAVEDEDVARVLALMARDVARPLTTAVLAAHASVSERTLELKFRRHLGRSPAEELSRVRVAHAKRLLVETDQSVGAIALASGFADAGHLCRVFKRQTGTTPGEHRRSRRGRPDGRR